MKIILPTATSDHFSRLLVTIRHHLHIISQVSCPMLKPLMPLMRKLLLVRSLLTTWSMGNRLSTNLHQTSKILGCLWRKPKITSSNLIKGSTNEENMVARDRQCNLLSPEQWFMLHCPPHNCHNPGMALHIHRERLRLMDSQANRSSTSESVVRNSLRIKPHHRKIQRTSWMILHGPFFEPKSTSSNPVQASKSPLCLSPKLSNSLAILPLCCLPFQPLCCQRHLTYLHCLTKSLLTRISNLRGSCGKHLLLTKPLSPSSTSCSSSLLLIQFLAPCGGKSFKMLMLILRSFMDLQIEDIVTKMSWRSLQVDFLWSGKTIIQPGSLSGMKQTGAGSSMHGKRVFVSFIPTALRSSKVIMRWSLTFFMLCHLTHLWLLTSMLRLVTATLTALITWMIIVDSMFLYLRKCSVNVTQQTIPIFHRREQLFHAKTEVLAYVRTHVLIGASMGLALNAEVDTKLETGKHALLCLKLDTDRDLALATQKVVAAGALYTPPPIPTRLLLDSRNPTGLD